MPGNRKLQRNGSTSDRVEESMRRLMVDDANGRVGDELGSYPDRPGEPNCIFYLRTGSCGYGSNCRFNHPSNPEQVKEVHDVKTTAELPERAGQPDCGYYLKTGTCKYGSTCKYHHPKDRQDDAVMNMLGLPMRQDARSCSYYMRTGICKYGNVCKFHHPQPALATNLLPVAGPIYGSGGSAVMPSSGSSSASDLSTAPLSKATYYATSLQHPQSYMPIYLSPSQGWNPYMGSINPLSATSLPTAPAPNGQLSLPYLPDRPDQPDCRYFMEHGSCKYGSECKYHHPIDKISQLASNSLGPLGLPLRPGQPPCSYYSLYGLCKYGPTCKFDHPMNAYPYAYNLSVPPLAAYAPPPSYQRTASLLPISETSISKASKLSDWIKKGAATASNKNQHSNAKSIEDSPDSLPHSSKASSEVTIQNESD